MARFLLNGVCSVDLIISESANAILTSKRRGLSNRVTALNALETMLDLVKNNIKLTPQQEIISEAYKLAELQNIAVYDALYLWIAKSLETPLVSLDLKQIELARKLGITIEVV